MRTVQSRARKGFTLVETLFAILMATMCTMIFAAAIPVANNGRAKANLANKATSLAQKQLEAVRSAGYANCTASQLYAYGLIDSVVPLTGTTYGFTNSDSVPLDNPARVLPGGTGRLTLEQPDLELRRVTIEVRWVERGTLRSIRLGTLIANL